jgi:UDP:flavonoid glycosyltransferase YjiC (YdhE family)
MHYGIFTYGTRGDVQPYIALALGLMEKGHEVTLAAPADFKAFVEEYGVSFHPLYGSMQELLYSPEGIQLLKAGSSISLLRFLSKAVHAIRLPLQNSFLEGAKKVDVCIVNNLSSLRFAVVAEKLQKKWAIVQLNPPVVPTKEFPALDLDFFNFPAFNLFTYRLIHAIQWKINKKDAEEFWDLLGLPTLEKPLPKWIAEKNILTLHTFSPELISRPKDWAPHIKVTGFLSMPKAQSKTTHSEELAEWLKKGRKPIYIGFGSIPVPDAALFSSILKETLAHSSERIVFCTGWSKLPDLPVHPHLFVVDKASHEWLLPQCQLAIVHGGIGTIAASLKAHIPVIVLSIFADQPWWGKILEKKKIGIHLPFKKLTKVKLWKAIEKAQSPLLQKNAQEMGNKINQEKGLEETIVEMEKYFA